MSVSGVSSTSNTTSNGTPIVKPNQDMDQNAFLKILSAELANQDPTNATDGTQYVAQMAQFAGLEQMANLNNTMKLSGMTGLIGKSVVLDSLDSNGDLYSGVVKSVSKDGDTVNLNVVVGQEKDSSGNMVDDVEQFDSDDVLEVENNS